MTPLLLVALTLGQPLPKSVEFVVTPAAPPVDALRWRLLLEPHEQQGDALALYRDLARAGFRTDQVYPQLQRLAAPRHLDRDAARALLARHADLLALLERAAQARPVDWGAEVAAARQRGEPFRVREMGAVQNPLPLLQLQARLALVEERPRDAVRAAGVICRLAHQIGTSPGRERTAAGGWYHLACDILGACVQHPSCPNLSVTLATLPRPLLDLGPLVRFESVEVESLLPGLRTLRANPAGPVLTSAVLDDLLQTPFRRSGRLEPLRALSDRLHLYHSVRALGTGAQERLRDHGFDAATLARAPALNLAVLHDATVFEQFVAQVALAVAGPYAPAQARLDEVAVPGQLLTPILRDRAAHLVRLVRGQLRHGLFLQRHVELLQAAEALRWHAGKTGTWPARLADVRSGVVPLDPGTQQAFQYTRTGTQAVLTAPRLRPDDPDYLTLTYRLTLRQPEDKP